jgi:hypothetical protein
MWLNTSYGGAARMGVKMGCFQKIWRMNIGGGEIGRE